jgi:hypothetical protein
MEEDEGTYFEIYAYCSGRGLGVELVIAISY